MSTEIPKKKIVQKVTPSVNEREIRNLLFFVNSIYSSKHKISSSMQREQQQEMEEEKTFCLFVVVVR